MGATKLVAYAPLIFYYDMYFFLLVLCDGGMVGAICSFSSCGHHPCLSPLPPPHKCKDLKQEIDPPAISIHSHKDYIPFGKKEKEA